MTSFSAEKPNDDEFTIAAAYVHDLRHNDRYVICAADPERGWAVPPKAIIWKRSNGTAHYMTYRSERGAIGGANRVERAGIEPHVFDRHEGRLVLRLGDRLGGHR